MAATPTSIPYHEAAREISLAVLEELSPQEAEVALGFLDPLIEMAADDELAWIDREDYSGSFGGSDVIFPAVVPAVVFLLTRIGFAAHGNPAAHLAEIEETLRQGSGEIEDIVRRVGSRRAAEGIAELVHVLRESTLRHFRKREGEHSRASGPVS